MFTRNRMKITFVALLTVPLIAMIARAMAAPGDGADVSEEKWVRIAVARIYLGDLPRPVPGPIHDLPPGGDAHLKLWHSAPYRWDEMGLYGELVQTMPHEGQDPLAKDPKTFELKHHMTICSKSKKYPVELNVTYKASKIQVKEDVIAIKRRIKIHGKEEFHALRSKDGKWLLLLRWQEKPGASK